MSSPDTNLVSAIGEIPGTRVLDRRLSVAPMMDCTDKHDRYLLRLISKKALLYTEMIATGALIHGDRDRFLDFNREEHPVALQLGGSEPKEMARCARFAEQAGFDEVNMNVGCPSDRVQSGRFGACLMAEPELVADCVRAMQDRVNIPVTVKSRIGIDHQEGYDSLRAFIGTVAKTGCDTFIVHARKAWLSGLSPKQNREIPPLKYEYVYRLKKEFPELEIIINGGITEPEEVATHLRHVDGVMVGRMAYQNPCALLDMEKIAFCQSRTIPERMQILSEYTQYIQRQLDRGVYLKHMARHLLGLFQGQPGAKAWRRYLSEHMYKAGAGVDVLVEAVKLTSEFGLSRNNSDII